MSRDAKYRQNINNNANNNFYENWIKFNDIKIVDKIPNNSGKISEKNNFKSKNNDNFFMKKLEFINKNEQKNTPKID